MLKLQRHPVFAMYVDQDNSYFFIHCTQHCFSQHCFVFTANCKNDNSSNFSVSHNLFMAIHTHPLNPKITFSLKCVPRTIHKQIFLDVVLILIRTYKQISWYLILPVPVLSMNKEVEWKI